MSTHKILTDKINPPQIKQAQRKLSEAITYDQFPEILIQTSYGEKQKLLSNYRDTYFIRDLMQISNIENMEGLLTIFNHLARSIGSHLEVPNFAREAGLSFPTTKKYLNTLYQSQLTFRLYGYQYGPAKRHIKAAKTYFSDNGIINSLKIPLNEGQLLENFVITEFEKRRKLGFLDCDQIFYYKSTAGRELDLIFEIEDVLFAIEIKATRQPSKKDIRNLREFSQQMKQPVKLFLFYLGDKYMNIDNVQVIPVSSLYCGI